MVVSDLIRFVLINLILWSVNEYLLNWLLLSCLCESLCIKFLILVGVGLIRVWEVFLIVFVNIMMVVFFVCGLGFGYWKLDLFILFFKLFLLYCFVVWWKKYLIKVVLWCCLIRLMICCGRWCFLVSFVFFLIWVMIISLFIVGMRDLCLLFWLFWFLIKYLGFGILLILWK